MTEKTIEERVERLEKWLDVNNACIDDIPPLRSSLEAHANNPLAHPNLCTVASHRGVLDRLGKVENKAEAVLSEIGNYAWKQKELDTELKAQKILWKAHRAHLDVLISSLTGPEAYLDKSMQKVAEQMNVGKVPESPSHWLFDESTQRVIRQMLEPDIERLAEVAHDAHYNNHDGSIIPWDTCDPSYKSHTRDSIRAILKAMPRQEPYGREALLHMQFIVEFTRKMDQRYREHRPKKGDSWRESDIDYLYVCLRDEHQEVQDLRLPDLTGKHPAENLMSELIDLALVAAMCHAREGEQVND